MKKAISPLPPVAVCLAILISIAMTPVLSHAQSLARAWRTYDRFDGFTGSWVYTTIQTPDTTLWFGTDQGVARYDGVWRTYDSQVGFPEGSVLSLHADADGELWAATAYGVTRLEGDEWVPQGVETGLPDTPFLSLEQTPDGRLWAGGEAGLFFWDAEAGAWNADEQYPAEAVTEMAVDGRGRLWAANQAQLYLRAEDAWAQIDVEQDGLVLGAAISVLEPSRRGGIWVGTDGQGVIYLDDGEMVWQRTREGLPSDQILALRETAEGVLWAGTNGRGVGYLHENGWSRLTIVEGLAADIVTSVFEDSDGIVWFGTVAGISRYDAKSWQVWAGEPGAPTGRITDLTLDTKNRLWVTTSGAGLYRFEDEQWEKISSSEAAVEVAEDEEGTPDTEAAPALPPPSSYVLPTDFTETSFSDSNGYLWVGTNGGGVVRFDQTGAGTRFTTDDGLAENIVLAIAEMPEGVMWFGTYRRGLSRWDGSTWQTVTVADGLTSNEVESLFADSSGRLWVGTNDGLSVLEGEMWRSFSVEDTLAAPRIMDIAEAADGSLWFATWGGGVNRLAGREWSTFSTVDGLLAPGVDAVWADPESERVWFGTISGLSVYDGRTWQNYGVSSGVGLGRVYALGPSPNGGLFIGTSTGVAHYFPDHTPPRVSVTSINGVLPGEEGVQVSPEEMLRITLNGADLLTDPGDLFYRYRLDGYEDEWHNSRTTQVLYPALPEGTYAFEAQARDSSLNYSPSKRVEIRVRREPITVNVPFFGPLNVSYALGGVALLTLLGTVSVYAAATTVANRTMRRQAVERRFNPYVAGSPLRDETMFYGRQGLIGDLEATLHLNSIMIHGERRIGKTSLLYQLKQRLAEREDPERRFIPVFVDLEGTPETEFFLRLMEGVVEAIAEQLPHMPGRQQLQYFMLTETGFYSDRDFRRDLRDILEFLEAHHRRQPRLIFLLDEADIMNTYDTLTQQQLRRILQDTFAANVGAVVTGVNINKAWDRVESPWYNMFLEIALKPFDRQAAEKLMREPVEQFYRWEEDAVSFVFIQSEGKPHRIQQICLEAVNIMLDAKRRVITLADVGQALERIRFAENN